MAMEIVPVEGELSIGVLVFELVPEPPHAVTSAVVAIITIVFNDVIVIALC